MNIKSSLFYAALAACLGTGYGAHYVVSQGDADRTRFDVSRSVECEDDVSLRNFKAPRDITPSGTGF